MIKVFMKYFLSVRNFANKFSSSSRENFFGVEFFKEFFFLDLRMCLELPEYFDYIQIGNKTCYIPKVSKLYVEKGYAC